MRLDLIRRLKDAFGIRKADVGGNDDKRRRLHSFAAQRERAISDLGGLALLEKAIASERGRVADCGPTDPILIESRILVAAARAVGLYRELAEVPGTRISLRSGESAVFWCADERMYYKVKNPFAKLHLKKHDIQGVLYEHVVHNILFPNVALEFLGIGEDHGEARFIFRQGAVVADSRPTDAQIAAHLESLGLYPEARYCFGDERLFVTDVLSTGDNVLLGDDNSLYFIDPIIGFKQEPRMLIDNLVSKS